MRTVGGARLRGVYSAVMSPPFSRAPQEAQTVMPPATSIPQCGHVGEALVMLSSVYARPAGNRTHPVPLE